MVTFTSINCVNLLEDLGSFVEIVDEFRGVRNFSLCQILPLDEIYKAASKKDNITNSILWVKDQKDLENIKLNKSLILVSNGDLYEANTDCLFIKSSRSRDIFGEITNLISKRINFEHIIVKGCSDHGYTVWNNVELAKDVVIGPGSSIGGPGFGYYNDIEGKKKRFAHLGGCIVKSRAEIGACVTIDSGTLSPTIISNDVKIDSNVHIGHNVKIGRGTVICASATICGSVEVGEDVFIGAGAIIMDKVKIPTGSIVGLGSVVRKTPKEKAKIIPVFENKLRQV